MAQPAPRASAGKLWGALFLACLLSGIVLASLWLVLLAASLGGNFGRIVGGALVLWVILTMQRGVVHMFTHWQPDFVVMLATALPGIGVGYLAVKGIGAVEGTLMGCGVQALMMRLLVPPEIVNPEVVPAAPPTFGAMQAAAAVPAPPPAAPTTLADDIDWRN